MTKFVVDASVAVKWFLDEALADEAERTLEISHVRIAPELILSEVAHALVKRYRGGELTRRQVTQAMSDLPRLVRTLATAHLASDAVEIALTYDRSAYDALYLALAIEQGCPLVTADDRLFNAMNAQLPHLVVRLQDLPTD